MKIPYGRQCVDDNDIEAVVKVLRSELITQGAIPGEFERAVAKYVGSDEAVAANSATSALHIACMALGVGHDDLVWTSANTFVASANCALLCGASVDFVDIDIATGNLSIELLEEKLNLAEMEGCLPKVVIPVHFSGLPCDMKRIGKLAERFGFKVIEDASHALGAYYPSGERCGCSKYSDATVFSFHPVKMVTSVEGGMVVTNDQPLAALMRRRRSHGITSIQEHMQAMPTDEIWGYQQLELGLNYRLSDVHAALGLNQLKKLDHFLAARRAVAAGYNQKLVVPELGLPNNASIQLSSFHLYVIRVSQNSDITQQQLFNSLRSNEIICNLHYIPVYRHPFYNDKGFSIGYCPEAEKYFRQAISIPIFPSLTEEQQEFVISTINRNVRSE